MANQTIKTAANQIARQADCGRINPLEASLQINALVGGLTRAIWNPGLRQFKVFNGSNGSDAKINVDCIDYETAEKIAALCYHQAQINGSLNPGEIHLGKGISSKHHARAFRVYVQELLAQYSDPRAGAS